MYKKTKYKIFLCISIALLLIGSICVKNLPSNERVLDLKVGCFTCYEDYVGPFQACWVLDYTCSEFQKFIYVKGMPVPWGCEAGAYWHTGCDAANDYGMSGSIVQNGFIDVGYYCSFDSYSTGGCDPDIFMDCVPDTGNSYSCSGSYDVVGVCSDKV